MGWEMWGSFDMPFDSLACQDFFNTEMTSAIRAGRRYSTD